MERWLDIAMKVDPELANRIEKDGKVELATRMADGKFDSLTKVSVKRNKNRDSVIPSLRSLKFAVSTGVVLGAMKLVRDFIAHLSPFNDMEKILAKLDSIGSEVGFVKRLTYLNTGLGLANLGVSVAGIAYIGKRLSEVQKDIQKLSTQIGHIKSILTNEKVTEYERLSMRFGAISTKLSDGDAIDRDEIEQLLIEMKTFVSEMIRNFYYDAMDADIIMEIVFNLLTAYAALLDMYVKDYYFDKGRFPDNLESYNTLFSELTDEYFLKLVEDYLIIKKQLSIKDAINAIQVQQLLVANCMLKHHDQIDILMIVETKEKYLSFMKITDEYIKSDTARLIPQVREMTGVSNCEEIIQEAMHVQVAV